MTDQPETTEPTAEDQPEFPPEAPPEDAAVAVAESQPPAQTPSGDPNWQQQAAPAPAPVAAPPVLAAQQIDRAADPAALAAAEYAKQLLQASLVVADARPRNVDICRQKILDHCMRPRFAEAVEYEKPVGNKKIYGPSIRFAEVAIREWGNISIATSIVHDGPEYRRLAITVMDMETNVRHAKEISVKKTVERSNAKNRTVVSSRLNSYQKEVFEVVATDDELMTKEAALISKAIRTEGLRLIPDDIIQEGLDTAKAAMRGVYNDNAEDARKTLISSFLEVRVDAKMLSEYLGHTTESIALDEWEDLRKIFRALREGAISWADALDMKREAVNPGNAVTEPDDDPDPLTGPK